MPGTDRGDKRRQQLRRMAQVCVHEADEIPLRLVDAFQRCQGEIPRPCTFNDAPKMETI